MASNPIDCIKLHTKYLSTDENISREAATDLALKEFEKLHGELEAFKKSIDKKYTIKKFVSPDKSQRIKEIQDDYQKQIDEANTSTPEPIKTPVTKSEGEVEGGAKVGDYSGAKKELDAVKEKHSKFLRKDGGLRANTPEAVKKEIVDAYEKLQVLVKQERDNLVSNDKRDTGLVDGIDRIKDNADAMSLVKRVMDRGMIPERQYNDFGKNLLHIVSDKNDKHEVVMQTAEIIQDFISRANIKADNTLARELQAAENLKFELTENETKQEPTKDIKPEQAESQPQPEKTIVEDKQGAVGKYEEKARKIADKILKAELPDWAKADLPEGTKKAGGDFESIKKAIANATIEMGKLLDKGVEFSEAVKKAVKGIVDILGEGKRADIEKGFAEDYKKETGFKEPPKPPIEEKKKEDGGGKLNDKGILTHLAKAKNIPEAAREGFDKEGLKYETKSQTEAEGVAKAVIEEMGIEDAVLAAEAMKFDGDVNSLIFGEALNQLKEQEDKATTPEEKLEIAKKFAEVGITYDKMARYGGRFNAAINYFYKKSPLGIVMMENAKRQDDFNQWSKGKNTSWKEYINDIKEDPDFKEIVRLQVQEELKRERAESRSKRIVKVRAVFKKAKDHFKGGATYSTVIPPKVITAAIDLMEKAYLAGETVAKVIQDGIDYISTELGTTAWDSDKFRKEWEGELKEDGKKKPLSDADLKLKVLEKFRKKLKGLTEKQKDEVIRKAHNQLIDSGALEYEDLRKIIANVIGRSDLTAAEVERMKDLVAKTNAVEDAAEKVRTERTPESFTQLRAAEIEAGRASKELSSLFYNKPDIIKRLTSIMQLSTLGIPALVNNPIYNIWNQATLRFPIGIVNTLIDAGISKVAKLFGREYDREYNIVAGQAEFFNKLGLGTRESFTQLFTGLSRMDYTAKEVDGHQIRPARSLRDLWKFHTGKKPLTKEQYIDKLIQGTIGIPAEVVARILNLGDKPQRFAAEGSQAAAFAKALGLKDMDYRIFVEFPREEAYRAYKAQGLSDEVAGQKADGIKESILQEGKRSTFQQDNLLNDVITRAAGVFGGKDSGTANLAKTLAISPYIKIPTNAFWSLYNLINPEVAILQSGIHAANAKRLKNKNELTKAKLQNREARYWMAHAIVGIGMRAAVIAMVKAGTFVPSSDEDDSKKERDANALFDRPGYVNINGMKISNRWFAQWGMMGNAIAKKWQDATPEQREAQDDFWNIAFGGMELEALGELENGVFANSSAIFQAISQKDFSRYGISTLNMMANILQPASIAQINRAALDEVPNSKGDTFLDRLNQSFAQRSTLYRELFNVQLRQKRDMWGNTMPKGGNILSRMFGISKANPQLAGRPMYNDAIRTSDSGFLPPSVLPILNGQKLNVEQEDRLIQYIGNEREKLVMPFVSDKAVIDGWNSTYSELKNPDGTSDDETKKYVLSRFYDIGRINGTELFYKDYPEFRPKEQPIDYAEQVKKEIFNSLLSIQKYKK